MQIAMAYEGGSGGRIEFGADGGELHLFENAARNASWKHDTANGRITRLYKEPAEIELKVGIAAETEERGLALREELVTVTERDALNFTAGKLWCNGWYLPCFVTARKYGEWWHDGRFCECELGIACEELTWYRAEERHFFAVGEGSSADAVDYPHDFAYDYGTSPISSSKIENQSLSPADAVIRMYGPCSEPHVTIGGNAYGVKVTLDPGEYVEIDTRAQTIVKHGLNGALDNVFGKRYQGGEDSSSYAFRQVPSGVSDVASPGDFSFDITVFEHRSEPEWS